MFSVLNLQSLLGLLVIVVACWGLSENRKAFPWRLALGAVALQAALVAVLFGIPGSDVVLTAITGAVDGLTRASAVGAQFVWGPGGGGGSHTPLSWGISFAFTHKRIRARRPSQLPPLPRAIGPW